MGEVRARPLAFVALVLVAVAAAGACRGPRTLPPCVEAAPEGATARVETGGDPVVLAAGDIADERNPTSAEATARLLDQNDGTVLALGDEVQGDGSLDELLDTYGPSWGRHRWRTRPVPGNHEYLTPNAGPYFAYFCAAAGPPFEGFYSFDLGAWHLVALNSICADGNTNDVDCAEGSEQERWLRADLAAHPTLCTLAYWHQPRFSSVDGDNGGGTRDLWRALHDAGAELVLNGHAHVYERFAPQTPDGVPDPAHGIREIIVGTGGAPFVSFDTPAPNSEVRITGRWGVLKLTLRATSYAWQLLTVDGAVADEGSAPCH
jgi:acid phosphatase type 7